MPVLCQRSATLLFEQNLMKSTSYKQLPVFEPFFPNRYATIHFIYFLKIKIKMKREWKVWHEGVKSLIYKGIMSKEVWHFSGTSLAIATLLIMWNEFCKKITGIQVCSGARPTGQGGLLNGVSLLEKTPRGKPLARAPNWCTK